MKKINNRLQYEFLPSALEITESPPPIHGRLIIWMTLALVVVATLWLIFGKIDEVTTASGSIIPQGDVKNVEPSLSGTVKSIDVSEGDHVKTGQAIVHLDDSSAQSDLASTTTSLQSAELERQVLTAISAGQDATSLIDSSNVSDDVKQDLLSLANSNLSASQIKQKLLNQNLTSDTSQLISAKAQLDSATQAYASAQNDLQTAQTAYNTADPADNASQQATLQAAQTKVGTTKASLQSAQSQVSSLQSEVNQANSDLSSAKIDVQTTNASLILDQDKTIAQLQAQVDKDKLAISQCVVKAPADGIISSLVPTTNGQSVSASQSLATLVPDESKMIVTAYVQNKDRGFIQVGESVSLKVDAYAFQQYGTLPGTVKQISATATTEQKGDSVYKVDISIAQTKKSMPLSAGMTVTSEIKTGQRNIASFFINPVRASLDTSLKVR